MKLDFSGRLIHYFTMAFVSRIVIRGFASSGYLKASVQDIVIIGGGQMGAGIAQVAAQTGHKVTVVDVNQEMLDRSKARISESIRRVAKKMFKEDEAAAGTFVESALANVSCATCANEALISADLLVEAVVENMELKKKLFSEWDKIAPAKTIFASNTSSLPISEIAATTTRADRFGGLHFFNPVPVMKLLEVVRIPETSDATYNAMVNWGQALGKATVECKDTPGFIVNRLLVPYLMEAIRFSLFTFTEQLFSSRTIFRMVERGDASAKDVDTAMKLGAGYPMGPFELADYIGLDTNKFIMDGWSSRFPEETLFK